MKETPMSQTTDFRRGMVTAAAMVESVALKAAGHDPSGKACYALIASVARAIQDGANAQ